MPSCYFKYWICHTECTEGPLLMWFCGFLPQIKLACPTTLRILRLIKHEYRNGTCFETCGIRSAFPLLPQETFPPPPPLKLLISSLNILLPWKSICKPFCGVIYVCCGFTSMCGVGLLWKPYKKKWKAVTVMYVKCYLYVQAENLLLAQAMTDHCSKSPVEKNVLGFHLLRDVQSTSLSIGSFSLPLHRGDDPCFFPSNSCEIIAFITILSQYMFQRIASLSLKVASRTDFWILSVDQGIEVTCRQNAYRQVRSLNNRRRARTGLHVEHVQLTQTNCLVWNWQTPPPPSTPGEAKGAHSML